MRENIRENLKDEGNLRENVREDVMYPHTVLFHRFHSYIMLTLLCLQIHTFSFSDRIDFKQRKQSKNNS